MQKIILSGRTGKYVTTKEVTLENGNKIMQATFSVFVNGFGKDAEPTIYRCIYRGANIKKVLDSLFVAKGTYTKADGNIGTEYHSRAVVIDGTMSITKIAQQLPVVGLEDVFEEVLAPSITIFVNLIDFMDANPSKKDSTESTSDATTDERLAHREKIRKMKEEAKEKTSEDAKANRSEEFEEEGATRNKTYERMFDK